jgi:hypothetical protein
MGQAEQAHMRMAIRGTAFKPECTPIQDGVSPGSILTDPCTAFALLLKFCGIE